MENTPLGSALGLSVLLAALALYIWAWYLVRRARRTRTRVLRWIQRLGVGIVLLAGLSASGVGGYLHWYLNRDQPAPVERELFEGVTYQRWVLSTPRPVVAHLVRIDLDTPNLSFLVTPPVTGDTERALVARTTSEFLTEFDLQLAINAGFFEPWRGSLFWDYYPKSGDSVDVHGLAASEGQQYGSRTSVHTILYVSQNNRASFGTPLGETYNAISGHPMLVSGGTILDNLSQTQPEPRTIIGLDESDRFLLLFVVDGRQPNYSEGLTLRESAAWIRQLGAHNAMNLDGGGSSALAVDLGDGSETLNSPIHQRIPGWERPVGNHLGLRVD